MRTKVAAAPAISLEFEPEGSGWGPSVTMAGPVAGVVGLAVQPPPLDLVELDDPGLVEAKVVDEPG